MRTGPPTAEELSHVISIRNLVEGRQWDEDFTKRLVDIIRLIREIDYRRRESKRDLESKRRRGIR